jgi:hypothetical protein
MTLCSAGIDALYSTPYTLHPTPYTLHPTPYTLHPTPFAAQVLTEPSEPSGIEAVRVWDAGRLHIHVAIPSDSGDGLCVLGRKPSCCSGANSSLICNKCRQKRALPCPLVTRYRLELDDSPVFDHLDFVRDYDVPAVSRRLATALPPPPPPPSAPIASASPVSRAEMKVSGEAELISGGPEDADSLGGGIGDMKDKTLYRLEADGLPLGAWLYVRVSAGESNTRSPLLLDKCQHSPLLSRCHDMHLSLVKQSVTAQSC